MHLTREACQSEDGGWRMENSEEANRHLQSSIFYPRLQWIARDGAGGAYPTGSRRYPSRLPMMIVRRAAAAGNAMVFYC